MRLFDDDAAVLTDSGGGDGLDASLEHDRREGQVHDQRPDFGFQRGPQHARVGHVTLLVAERLHELTPNTLRNFGGELG